MSSKPAPPQTPSSADLTRIVNTNIALFLLAGVSSAAIAVKNPNPDHDYFSTVAQINAALLLAFIVSGAVLAPRENRFRIHQWTGPLAVLSLYLPFAALADAISGFLVTWLAGLSSALLLTMALMQLILPSSGDARSKKS